MPAESSIYWDSVDSQRSTSSGSGSRHYVDPWDLENYAYLRRHSVSGITQLPARQTRREPRASSEYWCSSSVREPRYDAPAFVEEAHYGYRQPSSCYHHLQQPIYEDEMSDYAALFPTYAPLPGLRHGEAIEDHGRRHKFTSVSVRERLRNEYHHPGFASVRETGASRREFSDVEPASDKYMIEMMPPPNLDLNTYGHLKIDYTNSWNSLNRKINK